MRQFARTLATSALALSGLFAYVPAQAADTAPAAPPIAHVAWSKNANIYEVNIRQYTKEGTFKAFAAHLPRLKKMGVDILWLMPIQPIGEKNRKGTLGSYYAVRDYTAVNPEFGNLADFKALVKQAHGLGMKVIIDWVANHTAFDNRWTVEHKDWYLLDEKGEIFPVTYTEGAEPEYWTDVTGLDYRNKDLWKGMTDAMLYWVRETDIDGFRCDVAGKVPTPFWNQARDALDRVKPVFMLAEADKPELQEHAFDMSYGWDTKDLFKDIAKGKKDARALKDFLAHPPKTFPAGAYRMRFTSNHDENSWSGSDVELYGPAFKAMAVLAATLPGMPLIYGGQEAGLDKRIEFFEKDPIAWKNYPYVPFYTSVLKLKHDNPALWNGQYGGGIEVLETGNDKVFAFLRRREGNTVKVSVNLSNAAQKYALPGARQQTLAAWDYRIEAPAQGR
ncbi:alpha-amylase family glycosyl hydrolase [Massilia norwichensis]|uniref:Alpha-amylase family glycosyl hydrolase n=1 Tax=Massilia norwichensis TaxID=1442366 RepID=A0ABT2A7H4_9BURK|nr:alpha-amylase family glycosyl hydrolase [Massilia norwichensis]MCS0590094.1 alpha-amylase family glycosyl hydrolase [Massilia norwichensis]